MNGEVSTPQEIARDLAGDLIDLCNSLAREGVEKATADLQAAAEVEPHAVDALLNLIDAFYDLFEMLEGALDALITIKERLA